MDSTTLLFEKHPKKLGVFVDQSLNSAEHCKRMSAQASRRIAILKALSGQIGVCQKRPDWLPTMLCSDQFKITGKKLPTNMPQFITRTHLNWYTKKLIKNIGPCPGWNPLILLLVSFPTSTLQIHDTLKLKCYL